TLDERDAQSSAAVALFADVDRRVAPLHVGDRFPVRLPWTAALVPVLAIVLLVLLVFWHPDLSRAQANNQEDENTAESKEASEAKKKLETLVKKMENRKVAEKTQSPEMQRIEQELDKLARQPIKTNDEARDALKDLTSIEDALKKKEQEEADKK